MNKYERLKELEVKIERYRAFFQESKGFDNVCLSKHPHKRLPFFEQKKETKRVSGIPQILDLPDTLNLRVIIDELLTEDYKSICAEFAELQKDL